MSPDQALRIAQEGGQDLVEVSPDAVHPVCRILDYGKVPLPAQQEGPGGEEESRRSSRFKEVKFRPKTTSTITSSRKKQHHPFPHQGKKVKATVIFRGRENMHATATGFLKPASGGVGEFGVVETDRVRRDRSWTDPGAPRNGSPGPPRRCRSPAGRRRNLAWTAQPLGETLTCRR